MALIVYLVQVRGRLVRRVLGGLQIEREINGMHKN